MNNLALIVLIAFSVVGFAMGLQYYFKAEQTVQRRINPEHLRLAEQDAEFRHWLELEMQTQVNRTRKIGMILIILEVIYVALILFLWQGNYLKLK